jgi:ubiquinone/menaquinone biosynthesis C-methylase UbiE
MRGMLRTSSAVEESGDNLGAFFDGWAVGINWLGTLLEMNYGHPLFLRWIVHEIPLRGRDRIIDIGCGTGWLARDMARRANEGEVVGIDISEALLKRARQLTDRDRAYPYDNLLLLVADVEDIPYPNGHFDHALSTVSLSFWIDVVKGLKEIKRVLKEGGVLYVADVYKGSFSGALSKVSNTLISYKENIYTPKQFEGFFVNAGFEDIYQKKKRGMLLTSGSKKRM